MNSHAWKFMQFQLEIYYLYFVMAEWTVNKDNLCVDWVPKFASRVCSFSAAFSGLDSGYEGLFISMPISIISWRT